MTNPSGRPPGDGGVPPAVGVNHDDASDATPPGVRGAQRNEELRVEKTVKFRFIGNHKGEAVVPAKFHLHWIQAVQEYFGKDVQVMNNNGLSYAQSRYRALDHEPARKEFQGLSVGLSISRGSPRRAT